MIDDRFPSMGVGNPRKNEVFASHRADERIVERELAQKTGIGLETLMRTGTQDSECGVPTASHAVIVPKCRPFSRDPFTPHNADGAMFSAKFFKPASLASTLRVKALSNTKPSSLSKSGCIKVK